MVALGPTPNMRYLLGFAPLADERPCALILTAERLELVVPELNAEQVEAHTGLEARRWSDAQGPREAFQQAAAQLGLPPRAVLAVDDSLRADATLLLLDTLGPSRAVPAGGLMAELRMRKSAAELEALTRSAELADRALEVGAAACRPGVREREVAEAMAAHFRAGGVEQVDFTIVASGPNSAFPHHHSGARTLELGDTVILDIGATLDGYKSDVTRVAHLGQAPEEVQRVYRAVREANRRGREAVRAGVQAQEVDRAARQVLEDAGLGPAFLHRTGHGIGLEVHEPPWITSESQTVLEPGMVFSVEPGAYLRGQFGIRIEDIVAVTEDGSRRLTGLGHDLILRE